MHAQRGYQDIRYSNNLPSYRRKKTLRTSGGSFIQQTDHLSRYLLIIIQIKELKLEIVIVTDEVLGLTSGCFFSSGLFNLLSS